MFQINGTQTGMDALIWSGSYSKQFVFFFFARTVKVQSGRPQKLKGNRAVTSSRLGGDYKTLGRRIAHLLRPLLSEQSSKI
jgi:hypothetical protein